MAVIDPCRTLRRVPCYIAIMRLGALSLTIFFACAALPAQGAPGRSPPCLAGLVPTLVEGKFSGSVDCKQDHLVLRLIGKIASSGHQFTIYDYHYRLRLVCPECAVHGGQRVIVLRDGRYLGQYKPESVLVTVGLGGLILTPEGEPELPLSMRAPISVPISVNGPPSTVWVGGESLELFR
jgi:hypothetical protein